MDDFFTAFDFVNNYIVTSLISNEIINDSLQLYIKTNSEFLPFDDPYKKIECYWELEDNEISKYLNEMYENLKQNKYNSELFPKIISKISCIKNMNYEIELINNIIDEMKRFINEKDVGYIDFHTFEDNKEILKIYNEYKSELINVMDKHKIISNDTKIKNILDDDNWGIKLYQYVSKLNVDSSFYMNFFEKIDISLLFIKIKESNSMNVYNFKYLLDKIYKYNSVKNDYMKLFDLYELIKKESDTIIGVSKTYAIICLKEKIEKLIERIDIVNKKIIVNKARCKKCKDILESKETNDFKRCKCGAIAVDGGLDYIKRIGNQEDIEELSEYDETEELQQK